MAEPARGDLEEFLLTLPLCPADVAHWFRVGRLRNSLAARGLSISTPDAHVAQCALDLGAELLSADTIFRLVARHTKLSLFRL
jgi:predicted nucleic acid-binding protein